MCLIGTWHFPKRHIKEMKDRGKERKRKETGTSDEFMATRTIQFGYKKGLFGHNNEDGDANRLFWRRDSSAGDKKSQFWAVKKTQFGDENNRKIVLDRRRLFSDQL